MNDAVLISTHRLELAGRLREAFQKEGHPVDLVTDPAQLDIAPDGALLILTGDPGGEALEEWLGIAHGSMEIPVFAMPDGPGGASRARRVGVEEAFESDPHPDEVVLLGKRIISRRRLQNATGIVGESETMREVLERVVQIAPVDSTVLVTGESGTGKELVARGIHALSGRRHRAFLAVNVAALSETLLESELFGHEKGAFTGAIDARRGFFELAHRGTLFLDEIGEMPLSTQTKLLRVLEQREFLRVGGEKSIEVDIRIIAATNQDLRQLVSSGRFRRDLYYRLNVLAIELPPLRRRREDIPRLVKHFEREVTMRLDRPFKGISDETMEVLVRYDWPGNVRELRNLVESMVVLSPGRRIELPDIPREIRFPSESRRLLPVPVSRPSGTPGEEEADPAAEESRIRPELEFVFRTLVELRMDMDQLRQEFERYRDDVEDRLEAPGPETKAFPPFRVGEVEVGIHPPRPESDRAEVGSEDRGDGSERAPAGGLAADSSPEASDEGVVFRPGMTMADMEREAIRTMLRRMEGNRRRAAEGLGIGERTLYRKIRKYGIEE